MKIIKTAFKGLLVIQSERFVDNRGYFREIFKKKFFKNHKFKFWCMSKSKKNVIRGLHIQIRLKQDLIVSVIKGEIFDVALDLRKKSSTYGKYYYAKLSDKNSTSLFIPAGFAHGFCSMSNENIILGNSLEKLIEMIVAYWNIIGIMWINGYWIPPITS